MVSGVASETCSAKIDISIDIIKNIDISIDITKKMKSICGRVHF